MDPGANVPSVRQSHRDATGDVGDSEVEPLSVLLLVRASRERLSADARGDRARVRVDRVDLDVARVKRRGHLQRVGDEAGHNSKYPSLNIS